MKRSISHVALVVRDYDEAIAFFTKALDFVLVEDAYIAEQDKRWVVVAPPGAHETRLLLARAANPEQAMFIGNQTGGRVSFFLRTDDFWRDYRTFRDRGVEFVREPSEEAHGTVAVFKDVYGNLWDLVEPRRMATS
jgi:catechol 2,3-dioxygenase-like lactoylglutathione lyase family enzyme